jgi:hypothetical protein
MPPAWTKRSNTASSLSAGVPAPVSLTATRISAPTSSARRTTRTAGRRELERVLEQVAEHLEDPRGVERRRRQRRGDLHDEERAPLMIQSSDVILTSKATGEVVYAGSANDEG